MTPSPASRPDSSRPDSPRKIVLLTGSELRHAFFRKAMALMPGIEVLRSYCEGTEKSLRTLVETRAEAQAAAETRAGARAAAETRAGGEANLELAHLAARERSEEDFFGSFVRISPDRSNPLHLPKGAINAPEHTEAIAGLRPDLLLAYGCSIIREPLLGAFERRFLNVHLGLSPYYRGSGTNFWPLVNGEPEYVGATFMFIDAGIDTGEIIHQMRARVFPGDTPHSIGNRLIADMVPVYGEIARRFAELAAMPPLPAPASPRFYRKKDFTEDATRALYARFASGLVDRYLADRERRCAAAPILENPALPQPQAVGVR
jgi:phosphoribosylglycinamide formyltransferase 1